MKYLLVLLVVLLGAWGWRQSRRLQAHPPEGDARPPAAPEEMTRCALCAVHLPKSEAVQGRRGFYCCAAHQQQAEG